MPRIPLQGKDQMPTSQAILSTTQNHFDWAAYTCLMTLSDLIDSILIHF